MHVVGEVYEVHPDQVVRGERLRPVDPIWAATLAQMFDRDGGQHTPAQVTRDGADLRLILGGHRHEAARLCGRPLRVIVEDVDGLSRRSREIEDNLLRRELHPIDRASLLHELIQVEKARAGLPDGVDGRAASAAARWHNAKHVAERASDTMSLAFGWTEEVADQVGLSRRAIYRDLQLHNGLAPDVAARLRGLPAARNAAGLRSLAKLSADAQRAAAGQLVAGDVGTLRDAIAAASGKVAPNAAARSWSTMLSHWRRLSHRERRLLLLELDRQGLPPGLRLVEEAR